jgi:hypothetical protein
LSIDMVTACYDRYISSTLMNIFLPSWSVAISY